MSSHLLGASVQLRDLVQLRAECGPWRRRAYRTAAPGGMQRTSRRGRGLEIEEIRAYQHGDDARDIDWRVTARKGRAHTKVYREQREQPVLFALDLRSPMAFGSRDRFKSVAVAELFALQAWAALADEDRVGAVIASPAGIQNFAPQRSESAVLRLLAQVVRLTGAAAADAATPTTGDHGTSVAASLDALLAALSQHVRAGHRCVVISDFYDINAAATQRLQHIARLGETTCVLVYDRLEEALPPPGNYALLAADGHARLTLNSADGGLRTRYAERMAQRREQLAALGRRSRVRIDELCVDEPVAKLLTRGNVRTADPYRNTAARLPSAQQEG